MIIFNNTKEDVFNRLEKALIDKYDISKDLNNISMNIIDFLLLCLEKVQEEKRNMVFQVLNTKNKKYLFLSIEDEINKLKADGKYDFALKHFKDLIKDVFFPRLVDETRTFQIGEKKNDSIVLASKFITLLLSVYEEYKKIIDTPDIEHLKIINRRFADLLRFLIFINYSEEEVKKNLEKHTIGAGLKWDFNLSFFLFSGPKYFLIFLDRMAQKNHNCSNSLKAISFLKVHHIIVSQEELEDINPSILSAVFLIPKIHKYKTCECQGCDVLQSRIKQNSLEELCRLCFFYGKIHKGFLKFFLKSPLQLKDKYFFLSLKDRKQLPRNLLNKHVERLYFVIPTPQKKIKKAVSVYWINNEMTLDFKLAKRILAYLILKKDLIGQYNDELAVQNMLKEIVLSSYEV